MNHAPALSHATISSTRLRHFIQHREDDGLLLHTLRRHFDDVPARAMLAHRVPQNRWQEGQIDGAAYHNDLSSALHHRISPGTAHPALRPALALLQRYHFTPRPAGEHADLTLESTPLGLRGKPDLPGYAGSIRALVEIKTIHEIPERFPYLEHSIQTALLFELSWGHRPHARKNFVRVLYVESRFPHRAYLMPVQLPHRFCAVAADLAKHLVG